MSARQIMLVAGDDDRDADEVEDALVRIGQRPVRLDAADLPVRSCMSLRLDETLRGDLSFTATGRQVDLDQLGAVWWSGQQASGIPDSLSTWEREFAIEELDQAYRGLWAALDCYWMSRPDKLRRAGWTLGQLDSASRVGFDVPRAVVTTSPDTAFDFYSSCDGQVIGRELTDERAALAGFRIHHPDLPAPDQSLLHRTRPLDDDDLVELGKLHTTPRYLQQQLPSRLDLRVTVVGDEVLAAGAENSEDTPPVYRPEKLPSDVADRCVEYVNSYGLTLSTLDLIVTPDDRYVFVGAKPGGRIGQLQRLAPEVAVADAVASCLVRGAA